MKIAVVQPWGQAKWAFPQQHDGLQAALELIGKDHQVDWYLSGDEPKDEYDWILPWGVGSIDFNFKIQNYKKARKALFCAGHPDDLFNIEKFETVFVESPAVYEKMRPHCKRTVLAFGVDTDYFKPTGEKKIYDACYVATFSPWKRQRLFGQAIGPRGIVAGTAQIDGQVDLEECQKAGTNVLLGLLPYPLVSRLYNVSRTGVITSWHGSERTVLEMMSSNLPLVLTKDNELACSLTAGLALIVEPTVEEVRKGFETALTLEVHSRDYILEKYSHRIYAQKILEVLAS